MTNKTERYFVVSESELDAYAAARSRRDEKIGGCHSEIEEASRRLKEMYDACRARPVTEEQALLLGLPSKYDLEMKILKDAGD